MIPKRPEVGIRMVWRVTDATNGVRIPGTGAPCLARKIVRATDDAGLHGCGCEEQGAGGDTEGDTSYVFHIFLHVFGVGGSGSLLDAARSHRRAVVSPASAKDRVSNSGWT